LLDKYSALEDAKSLDAEGAFVVTSPIEKQLALQLLQFGPTVLRAARAYKPSVLADYLFQTAQLYSSFYQRSPVLKADAEIRDGRIRLCALFGKVLSTGLHILGIETPRRI
jgi:arginyl-tRNA synthetase